MELVCIDVRMCVEFDVGRAQDHGCTVEGPGPMGPRDTKDVRKCEFFKKFRNPKKDMGSSG